jgi:hypothetical protein
MKNDTERAEHGGHIITLVRQWKLLVEIAYNGEILEPDINTVADLLKVSYRTIDRDLQVLAAAGLTINQAKIKRQRGAISVDPVVFATLKAIISDDPKVIHWDKEDSCNSCGYRFARYDGTNVLDLRDLRKHKETCKKWTADMNWQVLAPTIAEPVDILDNNSLDRNPTVDVGY